ncbi:hypothetical protein [Gordonia oryzae]|nr:hypothetical protein [Gordonia oryzae]
MNAPQHYPGQPYPQQLHAGPPQPYPYPQPYPQQQNAGPYPVQPHPPGAYRAAPTGAYRAVFKRHTGMVVLALTNPTQTIGTWPEIRKAFWAAQTHCLTLGWWGIISCLVYNWIAIFGNIAELNRVRELAKRNGDA